LNAQSVSTGIIRGVVLVVVVLGIASVLVVSVVQKRREIGILRAMGATRGQVLRVFLLQGALVSVLGSALGLVLAVVLIGLFTRFVRGTDGLPLFAITSALGHRCGSGAHRLGLWRAGGHCTGAPRRRARPGAGHPHLNRRTPMPSTDGQPLILLRDVRKTYNAGQANEAEVLHGLDLRIDRGEFVALMGRRARARAPC